MPQKTCTVPSNISLVANGWSRYNIDIHVLIVFTAIDPEQITTDFSFVPSTVGWCKRADTGAAFIAVPQIPPRNLTWAKKGKWVHWSKIAFEKYFIFNIKRGSTDPLFQKLALKVMGLNRLKD